MTTSTDSTSPQVLQTYTLLQIAAEAFLGVNREAAAAVPGNGAIPLELIGNEAWLTNGNLHSSRMTKQQAEHFAKDWKVVSHQPNTATGFSGTLFEYIGDADKRLTNSKYVVSFRSTEFIEDSARDSVATNELEITKFGWAFGQIADMQTWWNSVRAQVGSNEVDVTGYSLGGHLATAFNLLHTGQVGNGYTFNDAGVGELENVIRDSSASRYAYRTLQMALRTAPQRKAGIAPSSTPRCRAMRSTRLGSSGHCAFAV